MVLTFVFVAAAGIGIGVMETAQARIEKHRREKELMRRIRRELALREARERFAGWRV